jgi:hypothetical protein
MVEGMEGNDRFYVLSTNPNVETRLFGGLGSDTIYVGAHAPAVQANDLIGYTGLITDTVESTSHSWDGLPVDGIAAEILDNDAPGVILAPVNGALSVTEAGSTDSYRASLAQAPATDVEVTFVAPAIDPNSTDRARQLQLSLDGVNWDTSVTVVFTPANYATPVTIRVRAAYDLSSEGEHSVPILAMVVGRLGGSVTSATSTTLATAGTPFSGRDLTGAQVSIISGTGAGQTRTIVANTASGVTVAAWTTTPDATSQFLVRGVGSYDELQLPATLVRVRDDDAVGVVITEALGGTRVI